MIETVVVSRRNLAPLEHPIVGSLPAPCWGAHRSCRDAGEAVGPAERGYGYRFGIEAQ